MAINVDTSGEFHVYVGKDIWFHSVGVDLVVDGQLLQSTSGGMKWSHGNLQID